MKTPILPGRTWPALFFLEGKDKHNLKGLASSKHVEAAIFGEGKAGGYLVDVALPGVASVPLSAAQENAY